MNLIILILILHQLKIIKIKLKQIHFLVNIKIEVLKKKKKIIIKHFITL